MKIYYKCINEDTGVTEWGVLQNLSGTVAPTVNDDANAGYQVGSTWIDTVADKEYICLDATAGAAVWKETTAGGSGSTNLGIGTKTGTTVEVTSDTGTDAVVPAATVTEAGLLTAADKSKLDGIPSGFTESVTGAASITGLSWALERRFTFAGTNKVGTPSKIYLNAWRTTGNSTFDLRIVRADNAQVVAELLSQSGTDDQALLDMGTLSNLPTARTVLEVHAQVGNGSTAAFLGSVYIEK